MSVPKSLQPAFDGIEPLITDYCNQYLNDEYRELCLHLLEKLSLIGMFAAKTQDLVVLDRYNLSNSTRVGWLDRWASCYQLHIFSVLPSSF